MRIQFSRIKNWRLRRILMVASLPLVAPYGLVAGALYGARLAMGILFESYGRVWRDEVGRLAHAECGVLGDRLAIFVPLDLLAFATEQGPWTYEQTDPLTEKDEDRLRITDPVQWGKSVAAQIRAERGESGASLLHTMVDDAIREAIESADAGFVWPAADIDTVEDVCRA